MNAQLNVKRIFLGAFVFPWHYRSEFLKALFIPMLILVGFEQAMDHLVKPRAFNYWILFLLYLGTAALFSVICHRLVLLDPQKISSGPVLQFKGREFRFLYWLITLGMITIVIALPGVALSFLIIRYSYGNVNDVGSIVAIVLAAIPALYVISRLSVIFPAIATDRKISLKWAWKMTAINGWRITVITAGLPVLMAVILGVFYRDEATLIESVVLSFIGSALTAVEVVALSLAYQDLVKSKENDAEQVIT